MTSNFKSLTNVCRLVTPIYITIPNGHNALVEKLGMSLLHCNLILRNVLYIPTFMCNLISIRQLTRDENCTITYGATHRIIHDLTSKKSIRAGEKRNGVYYLKTAG